MPVGGLKELYLAADRQVEGLPRRPLDDKVPALAQQAAVLPQVTGLAYRPDGGELAVGGYREVRRLVPGGGGALAPLAGLHDQVRAVAYSPDGTWLAAAGGVPGSFGEIAIYDAASGALRWTLRRDLSVAVGVRTFGYDHAASDGYFAPERYRLAEASVRAGFGGELGWRLDIEAGGGQQMIQGFYDSRSSRFAQRANVAIAWRPGTALQPTWNRSAANRSTRWGFTGTTPSWMRLLLGLDVRPVDNGERSRNAAPS